MFLYQCLINYLQKCPELLIICNSARDWAIFKKCGFRPTINVNIWPENLSGKQDYKFRIVIGPQPNFYLNVRYYVTLLATSLNNKSLIFSVNKEPINVIPDRCDDPGFGNRAEDGHLVDVGRGIGETVEKNGKTWLATLPELTN
jgi:hypothetical protein